MHVLSLASVARIHSRIRSFMPIYEIRSTDFFEPVDESLSDDSKTSFM